MPDKATIKSMFDMEHGQRQNTLDRARTCAALTIPQILPPQDQEEDCELPENYQSIGSRGITSLEGKMLQALFPVDLPWFELGLSPEIMASQGISNKDKQAVLDNLFAYEVLVHAKIESPAQSRGQTIRRRVGFRTHKRNVIGSCLATGDSLERIHDDFRHQMFRRDQYVTRRDSCGDVLHHITVEKLDLRTLSDDKIAMLDGKDRLRASSDKPADYMVPMYTRVHWHPRSERWVIEQEVQDVVINTSQEPVSPYISTPFYLVSGEHYGRGLAELNLGDLRSLDQLSERELDYAAAASKLVPAVDQASEVTAEDLAQPSGTPLMNARVQGGSVDDVAFLQTNKMSDFRVVRDKVQDIENRLGAAFLLNSASVRDSERTTAYEIQKINLDELESVFGGVYAPFSESQLLPTIERALYVVTRDNEIPLGTEQIGRDVRVEITTGIAALHRQVQRQKIEQFVANVTALGPEAMRHIDQGVLIRTLARYDNINEPGLVKSSEQVAQEDQAQVSQAVQAAAAEEAIGTAGAITRAAAGA